MIWVKWNLALAIATLTLLSLTHVQSFAGPVQDPYSDLRVLIVSSRSPENLTEKELENWSQALGRPASMQELEMIIGEIATAEDLYEESSAGKVQLASMVNNSVLAFNDPKMIADAILKYEFSPSTIKMIGLFELTEGSEVQRHNLYGVFKEVARRTVNSALRAAIYDQIESIEANFYPEED